MSVSNDGKVRVRFPPSPTGFLHLGGARTALFNWLYAKRNGGVFIFRVEDTDRERSKKEFEEQIIESLKWLGLSWDEGIGKEAGGMKYRQSERTDIYKKHLETLLSEGKAYWCYCTKEELDAEKVAAQAAGQPAKYSGRCRNLTEPPAGKEPQVIRLKIPEESVEFHDIIRGTVKTDLSLTGDIVIAKNLENALYNFAVVVDDRDMNVTHVIRGEDHISNTPKQIAIINALGFEVPEYGHLPLVLNADRSKLSKRYADVNVLSYQEQGYLPQALLNYLVLLGWHPADDREVFTLEELAQEFDMARVQKGGAIWNDEKLQWINREHLKKIPAAELAQLLQSFIPELAAKASQEFMLQVIEATRERMHTLADFWIYADFFFELPDYPADLLIWKKGTKEEAQAVLSALKAIFTDLAAYDAQTLEEKLSSLVTQYGKGNVLWPLRAALSGKEASPDPYTIAAVLGKEESLRRIETALNRIS
jgi:nondiscriminating glutamyl-tRNA synthetase